MTTLAHTPANDTAGATPDRVSVEQLKQKLDDGGATMIDVRTPMEFKQVHARGAVTLPLDSLTVEQVEAQRTGDGPVYVLCKTGGRSKQACAKLAAGGLGDAVVVDGGTDAWVAAGYPVVRGETNVISLERQVRIAAGSLVALGTAAGVLISPWFLIVPGFVGCGLVFAGVTDTCGMGMMLARMPWNRR